MVCFDAKLSALCVLAGALVFTMPAVAADADEDNTRAVKIIEAPDPPPPAAAPSAVPAPPPAPAAPASAPPTATATPTVAPVPSAAPKPVATPAAPSAVTPSAPPAPVATPAPSPTPAAAPVASPLPPPPPMPSLPPPSTTVATPAPPAPPPPDLSPFAPITPPAAAPPPAPVPQQAAVPPPSPNVTTAPAAPATLDYPVGRKQAALGTIPIDAKVLNTAEVSLELLPGLDITVGTTVKFRVTAKKPGYLIIVDVDAMGKLTQLYPAPSALTEGRVARPNANYLKPGQPLMIPSPGDSSGGVEYVASPPSGVAMIVAILSDKPVQLLDLPDVPTTLTGQTEALAFLTQLTKELRIPRGEGGAMQEAHWSFDAKFYAIR
jgi:hypothetical protein